MRRSFIFIFCLFFSVKAFCFSDVLGIPDSSDLRGKYFNQWFTLDTMELLNMPTQILVSSTGSVFRVSMIDAGGEVGISVVPRKLDYTFENQASGAWHLYRDKLTGDITRIIYFFQEDSDVFVQIRPGNPKNKLDFVIKGAYAAKNVPFGLPFNQIIRLSFFDLYQSTKLILPWHFVKTNLYNYINIRDMIEIIRDSLPIFEYVDDATYDENADAIFASTGEKRAETPAKIAVDSKGFVKWLVDSLLFSMNNELVDMKIVSKNTVATANSRFADNYEKNNTYITLDWTRNLANHLVSFTSGHSVSEQQSGINVMQDFFYGYADSLEKHQPVSYLEDAGYPMRILPAVLYVMSVQHPSYFFLGAVRKSITGDEDSTFSFDEAVAFFPHFDSSEKFKVVMFGSGAELDFEEFCKINGDNMVHLVCVKASDRFVPFTQNVRNLSRSGLISEE